MKDGWANEPLGEVAEVIMGQSPPSSTYNEIGCGLPFFQGKAEFGEIYPTAFKYCNEPLKIAERNDILMSVRAPVGPVNVSPERCCIGRGLCAIRPIKKKIDSTYLFYYLRWLGPQISKLGQGSTFTQIGKDDVKDILVPFPISIEVQHRISDTLHRAHSLKQKREQVNQLTSKITQSIFLKMFGDPVSNPVGWDIRLLGEISNKIVDGTHITPNYVSSGVPFLTIKNIVNHYFDLKDVKYITEAEHFKLLKHCKPEKGDILYSKDGTLGIAKEIDIDLDFSIFVTLALIKLKREIAFPTYIEAALNSDSLRARALQFQKGIGLHHLHLEDIRKIPIPIPPLKVQEEFIRRVATTKALVTIQSESAVELNRLFQSLMHGYFGFNSE